MADEIDKKRLVRFGLPRGLDAAAIVQAIREHGRRILDEAAEQKRAAERDAAEAQSQTPAKQDAERTEGAAFERPGAET
jgi:hypothetical protein